MTAASSIQLWSTNSEPYTTSLGPNFVCMNEYASSRQATAVAHWMSANHLYRMEVWPPQSLDLSPIEHVWDTQR